MSQSPKGDGWITKSFQRKEFWCPCCRLFNMKPAVIEKLQLIRDSYGPIRVISGSRCAEHNAKVGGKQQSAHLGGYAVDILCPSSFLRSKLVRLAIVHGVSGIGLRNTSVHLDWASRAADSLWLYPAKMG